MWKILFIKDSALAFQALSNIENITKKDSNIENKTKSNAVLHRINLIKSDLIKIQTRTILFEGNVSDIITGKPIKNVTVKFENQSDITDDKGSFRISLKTDKPATAKNKMSFENDDYKLTIQSIEYNTNKNIKIKLEKNKLIKSFGIYPN